MVLFPGSYDGIFIYFAALGCIIEVGFLFINLCLLVLLIYPGVSVILVDCCGVVPGAGRQ
jgi:hypothetical protein